MIHGYLPKMPIETQLVLPPNKKTASEWVRSIHDRAALLQEAGLGGQIRRASTQAKQYNKGKKTKTIKVGDTVRINMKQTTDPQSHKLGRLWKGPFQVVKRCGPVSFRVIDENGFELNETVHIDRMMLINDERGN